VGIKLKDMKKYYIKVIVGNTLENFTVFAEYYHSTTNNSTSSGNYAFYADKELVACYPIERTIIVSIEKIEEEW
jgi:hypothetical protein